ncbi:MAG: tetratricopeptide repeat protein, partial [Omnitrophica WOR_2 bacterium]
MLHPLVSDFILGQYISGKMRGDFRAASLFVDISGFSSMTDALMSHGQHGAEVLVGVMRSVFTPLIRDVYAQGGFVATQAGDAFTAFFPYENDPAEGCLRALAAACSIQQHAAAGPIHDTPYGSFNIGIKVGLAIGEVAWGIIASKDERRAAFYFQGTAVDQCAQVEHQAQPGDVIISAAMYRLVQGSVTVEPAGENYRLLGVTADLPPEQPVAPSGVNLEFASRFFPRELLVQSSSGEFRQVVNLFISLPTVRTEAQLAIFMQALFELQDRYGGLLRGLDFGDKGSNLLLIWGAPVAHENDIERALNFVLELQTQTEIPINGGVTYRVAHAGFLGSELREEYTTSGRGVNLAARFMTSASRGEIWADEYVARRARGQFELELVGERNFKGFTDPQKVYSLVERKEATEAFYEGRLVGREAELKQLEQFAQPIFQGKFPGAMIVTGEPGMGKSRLIVEFLQRLQETTSAQFQVFMGQTDEILREPLNPFRYWLKTYFGVSETQVEARNKRSFNHKLDELIAVTKDAKLAGELDRTRSFLGALVGLRWTDSLYDQLDAQARYENTFIALATLLQAESCQLPVVLFLEDVHWLDQDSRAFLPRLVRTLTADEQIAYPIALLATARSEGKGIALDGFPYQALDLGRLDRESLVALVELQLGGTAGEDLLALLEERAEGNPFFAEQILRYLREENLLTYRDNGWTVALSRASTLPTDVQAVLVARLDRLAQEVKEVVQTAAVLGREFEVQLLSWMLSHDAALTEKLARAEQASIWSALSEIRYLFKHALLRETAYDMQLRSRKQALHALAVEAIETVYADRLDQQMLELSYHSEQAGLVEKARRYLLRAGRLAQEAYQNSAAVSCYSRAIALTPERNLVDRYELLLALEGVDELLGKQDERQQLLIKLKAIAQEIGDPGKTAMVYFRQADLAGDTGDFSKAISLAEQAAGLSLSVGEVETAVNARGIVSLSLLRLGKLDEAIRQTNFGLDLARKNQDLNNEALLLNHLGLIAIEQRRLQLAQTYLEQSQEIAQRAGNLRSRAASLNNLGMVAGYLGDYTGARRYYEEALILARKIGYRSGEGLVLGNLGWVAGNIGEYQQARVYTEQNVRIAREIGDLYNEAYGMINLCSYSCSLGDYESALHYGEQGLDLARQIGERSGEAWALTYLGHCRSGMGQIEAAREVYRAAIEIRHELDQPLLANEPLAGLARVALTANDVAAAKKHVEEIGAYLDNGGTLDGA